MTQGARRGRTIASAPCTPALWRQNRRNAVPSAYALRLSGRARGNIPVKRALSPHPCGLPRPPGNASAIQTPPKVAASFQLKANANIAVSFQLKANANIAETDESPLEIGEPEKGRQGQSARDGGLRRTETGTKLPGAMLNNACVGPKGESQGWDE